MRRLQKLLASAAVAAALVMAVGRLAVADDHDDDNDRPRRLKAELKGVREVPVVSTTARGKFRAVLSKDESQIEYRLYYSGLEGTVTQSHIHVGASGTSGGISVWLCGTATNPAPPPPAPATIPTPPTCGSGATSCANPEADLQACGTLTEANIAGPAAQGIAALPPAVPANEFAELVKMIKSGFAYANVHSSMSPGGEIRGQITVD